jgi:hypothetical protein
VRIPRANTRQFDGLSIDEGARALHLQTDMRKSFGASATFVLLLAAPAAAKPWKGAELITHQTFRYGAFEARILAARGSGLITPFFLWKNGSEVPGAEWQEQDFEIFGRDGRYQTQLMTPGTDGEPRTEHNLYHDLPQPAWERYYTYRMEWTPEHLAFYVDGELVRIETDAEEYEKLLSPDAAEAAQLRVSLWAGDTGWSGRFDESAVPAATFVNWIQTFSYTPGSGPDGSDFSPLWRDDFGGSGSPDGSRWWAANWTFDYAVNDYVGQNARVQDGALVLVFTDEGGVGQFPSVPVDAGSSSAGSSGGGSTGSGDGDDDADVGGDDAPGNDPGADPGGGAVCEDPGVLLAAEDMSPSAGGASAEGWNLWSNGSLTAEYPFGGAAAAVSVRARGQLGGGGWPHMVITLGDEVVGDTTVASASYADYDFVASASASSEARELGVWFDNDYYQDGEDRNLYVDTVTIAPVCE